MGTISLWYLTSIPFPFATLGLLTSLVHDFFVPFKCKEGCGVGPLRLTPLHCISEETYVHLWELRGTGNVFLQLFISNQNNHPFPAPPPAHNNVLFRANRTSFEKSFLATREDCFSQSFSLLSPKSSVSFHQFRLALSHKFLWEK